MITIFLNLISAFEEEDEEDMDMADEEMEDEEEELEDGQIANLTHIIRQPIYANSSDLNSSCYQVIIVS